MLKYIVAIYGDHKLNVALLIGLSFALSAHSMAIPLVLGKMIDSMMHHQSIWMVIAIATLHPLIEISKSATKLTRQWIDFNKVWFPIQEYLRMKTLNQYFLFSIGQLKEKGSGLSRVIITSGEHSLQSLSTLIVTDIAPVITRMIITSVILLSTQLPVGLIVVCGLFMYGYTVWHMRKTYVPRIDSMQKKNIASSKQRDDLLAGAPLIKAFSKEDAMRKRYQGIYLDSVETIRETQRYIRMRNEAMNLILVATKYTATITCIYLFYENKITIGEILTARIWWGQVFDSIEDLGEKYQSVLTESTSAKRFLDLINTPPAIKEVADPVRLTKVAGFIAFKHVSFVYPADQDGVQGRPILRDISFHVHVGEKVAIVGASGSGKSTILSLLVRAYDPTAGVIEIDGQNLRTLSLSDLRKHVAIVDQDALTMEMTVAENINLGAEDPLSEEDLLRLCASVELDVTRLSKGLKTRIGEMGSRISGGERQRIAIARALASNAKVLILDEPTSALDAMTEANVQETIRQASRDRTTITIAHRLSTVQHADKIIVLSSDGEIVAQGTHRELLTKSPLYKDFVDRQMIHT